MESDPAGGFQGRHTNWLTIGGPLLGLGGGGLIALVVVSLTVTGFKPSSLFWATLTACGVCALAGVYITVAVFAEWPLPEPGPKTRRIWRLGALVILALVVIALLWFLHGVWLQNVTIAETLVVGVFIIAVLVLFLGESVELSVVANNQKSAIRLSEPVPQPIDPNADPYILRATIAQAKLERDAAVKEQDELRRQLEAARAHPQIYFYQEVDLPEFDPRRLVLNQTTERIRALNPFFYDVKKLESAEQRLSAAQAQIEDLKKQGEDAVRAEAAKYQSQIEAMLLACAESAQERDAAKAELATFKATFQNQVYRLARSFRELADSGDISESEEAFSRITAKWVELSPLYWAVKRNLENLLTHDHPAMVDLTKTTPLGRDSYIRMAKSLDRLAGDVPVGALAIPEPQREDDTTL